MSVDTRVGIVGLIVALFSIAAFYLWPDKKWIGWFCLSVGAILFTGWIVVELKQKLGGTWMSLATSVLVGATFGGAIAALIWHSATRSPSQENRVQESLPVVTTLNPQVVPPSSSPNTTINPVQPEPELRQEPSQKSAKKEAKSEHGTTNGPTEINQTMTNSPGGIQAGRDVTIGAKPTPAPTKKDENRD